MSHFQQEKFVEIASEYLNLTYSKKVFELGSYDINGSIKPLFSFNEYIGVDVSEGPNVDKVYDGKNLSFLSRLMIDCFFIQFLEVLSRVKYGSSSLIKYSSVGNCLILSNKLKSNSPFLEKK